MIKKVYFDRNGNRRVKLQYAGGAFSIPLPPALSGCYGAAKFIPEESRVRGLAQAEHWVSQHGTPRQKRLIKNG